MTANENSNKLHETRCLLDDVAREFSRQFNLAIEEVAKQLLSIYGYPNDIYIDDRLPMEKKFMLGDICIGRVYSFHDGNSIQILSSVINQTTPE